MTGVKNCYVTLSFPWVGNSEKVSGEPLRQWWKEVTLMESWNGACMNPYQKQHCLKENWKPIEHSTIGFIKRYDAYQ